MFFILFYLEYSDNKTANSSVIKHVFNKEYHNKTVNGKSRVQPQLLFAPQSFPFFYGNRNAKITKNPLIKQKKYKRFGDRPQFKDEVLRTLYVR